MNPIPNPFSPDVTVDEENFSVTGSKGRAVVRIPADAEGVRRRLLMDHFRIIASDRTHRSICGVFSDRNVCYTVGNTLASLPELVVAGPSIRAGAVLLNLVSDTLALRMTGPEYVHEEEVDLGGQFPVRLVPVSNENRQIMSVARVLNVNPFDAYQVLISDKSGRFPGDAGYASYDQNLDHFNDA